MKLMSGSGSEVCILLFNITHMFGIGSKQQLAEAGEREAAMQKRISALEAQVKELTDELTPLREEKAARVAQQQAETAAATLKAASAAKEDSPAFLIQKIKDLNPDTFPSKEAAREEFTRMIVSYWNIVKPQENKGTIDDKGLGSQPLSSGLNYVRISDNFYAPGEVDNPRVNSVIVLPDFHSCPADFNEIYESKRPANQSQYDQLEEILTPATCSRKVVETTIQLNLTRPAIARAGGLVRGTCK